MDASYNINGGFKPTLKRFADLDGPDFFPTPAWATYALIDNERFSGDIWECACGDGAMSRVLENAAREVVSSDLYDRGYGEIGHGRASGFRRVANRRAFDVRPLSAATSAAKRPPASHGLLRRACFDALQFHRVHLRVSTSRGARARRTRAGERDGCDPGHDPVVARLLCLVEPAFRYVAGGVDRREFLVRAADRGGGEAGVEAAPDPRHRREPLRAVLLEIR